MQTMDAALATLVRQGKITQQLAEQRSSHPDELAPPARRPRPDGGVDGHEHVRLQGDGPRRARRPTGEVEAESKQAVADQLKQRGLIVLDIADKSGSKEIKLPSANRSSRPT